MCTKRRNLQTAIATIVITVLVVVSSIAPSSASVWSWGKNDDYQLGIDNDFTQKDKPTPSTQLSALNVTKIAAGSNFALALTLEGDVYAWGNNNFGQCGRSQSTKLIRSPMKVSFTPAQTIIDIAAGELASFALTSSGDVYSWGWNGNGVLGHGNTTDTWNPTRIPTLSNVAKIFSHSKSALAIGTDGAVFAWGDNADGQLCLGNLMDQSSPVKVTINSGKATQIAPGFTHTLILVGTQQLYSCGSEEHGELGRDVITTNSSTPGLVNITLESAEVIRSISAGFSTSFASTSNLRLFAWGDNDEGELGLGLLPGTFPDPTEIPELAGKGGQISTGETFSVLLTDESQRTAYSWGNASDGELGRGNSQISSIPGQIDGFNSENLVQMSAGSQFAFALACACVNGGNCTSDSPYVCQCPVNRNGSLCEGCSLNCGDHGTKDDTACNCTCKDGYFGLECTDVSPGTSSLQSSSSDLSTLLLTLGATIAISLPLAILFVVIVLITVAVLVMYMRKSNENHPKAQRLFEQSSGNSFELPDSTVLSQPLTAAARGPAVGGVPSVLSPHSNMQSPIDPSPALSPSAAPAFPDGSKISGGWRFAADFDDDDDWVRPVASHSIELSSPTLASPFVKVPPAPFTSVRDIGFEENLNPRHRQTMEDGHCMIDGFGGVPTTGYFGIYDGHGGSRCVEFVQSRFHTIIQEEMERTPNDVKDGFKRAYARMDSMVEDKMGGSTSITVLVRQEIDPTTGAQIRKLYSANCGDARTVLCRGDQAFRITHDHKASEEQDDAEESERIRAQGGFVARGRVNGVLAVTRSLGDHTMKTWIISEPYQTEWTLTAADSFLVLACDGLWDVMKDQEVVDFVKSMKAQSASAQDIAAAVVKNALDKRTKDNISVMVIFL